MIFAPWASIISETRSDLMGPTLSVFALLQTFIEKISLDIYDTYINENGTRIVNKLRIIGACFLGVNHSSSYSSIVVYRNYPANY